MKKKEEAEMLTGGRYADKAAFDAHMASDTLAWLIEMEKEEENFGAPIEVLSLDHFAGFAR